MFDFRYHALSLAGVFLALMIGLLLGVAIGDKGLVSSAEHNVRNSLRGDVRRANARSADLQAELSAKQRFEEELYPLLVENKLAGQRIGLVGMGSLPDGVIRSVRSALDGTGGKLAGVAVIGEPVPESAVTSLRGASDPPTNSDYGKLGRQFGIALVRGGRDANNFRRSLLSSFSGKLDGLEGVIVYRGAPDVSGDDAANDGAFEKGFVDGVTSTGQAQIVGTEESSTDPSQIQWFKDRRISSVDSVDTVEGKAALVFVLAGANGSYGQKDSAQGLLPNSGGATP